MRKLRPSHIAALSVSTLFAVLGIVAPGAGQIHIPATSSVPFDLYIETAGSLGRGDYVLVAVPESAAHLAAERGYWSGDRKWIKRIAATTGDHVCIKQSTLFINFEKAGDIQSADSNGRPLSAFSICRPLNKLEYYVLGGSPLSYDSRYFGPLQINSIKSKLMAWTALF